MAAVILILLILFWILGYITIPGVSIPNYHIFSFLGHPIGLWGLLILILIIALIDLLPSPFQEIAAIALLLWILSLFGVISFLALPHIIVIALIIGIILFILELI